jgi:hypothetical protein
LTVWLNGVLVQNNVALKGGRLTSARPVTGRTAAPLRLQDHGTWCATGIWKRKLEWGHEMGSHRSENVNDPISSRGWGVS